MAKAKKKKRNKRTPQQLEKMRQKQREAMERNTLKNKKRIEENISVEKLRSNWRLIAVGDPISKVIEIFGEPHKSNKTEHINTYTYDFGKYPHIVRGSMIINKDNSIFSLNEPNWERLRFNKEEGYIKKLFNRQ